MGTRVGVLRGGRSAEREISISTGTQVAEALATRGFEVAGYDIDPASLDRLLSDPPDCVFVALHGRAGEDGTIQGLLEIAGIPYTGSGVLSSALAMSKTHTKRLLEWAGVPTPRWMVAEPAAGADSVLSRFEPPLVVKPADEGSAIGVSIVREPAAVEGALELAARYGDVIVEDFVDGVELTVPVLGNEPAEALPVIEIVAKTASAWYDYEAKYTPGMSEHVIPARVSKDLLAAAADYALRAHHALGCRDFSRVDMIAPREGDLAVLEVNTIPGLTPTSLFPDSARSAGIPFEDLCERLVKMALSRGGS